MREFITDWNIMPFQIMFIAFCGGFYIFFCVCLLLNLFSLSKLIIWIWLAGGVISRRMVVSNGTGVIKANFYQKFKSFVGILELTAGWSRNILKSMQWSKRKSTTGII